MQRVSLLVFTVLVSSLLGCQKPAPSSGESAGSGRKIAVISITSDAQADPQKVNMALTFARFCVDEKYEVAVFFNVKGVLLPTKTFADDFKYQEYDPLKSQIAALSKDGAEIHVCPVCMKDLDVAKEDIMEGAFVTTKPKLFGNLGPDTMVFTY